MNKFNFQNPIFLITVFSFLAAIAISVFLVWPRFQELEISRKTLSEKELKIQEKQTHFSDIEKKLEGLQEFEEHLVKITDALPDDAQMNIPSLFRFIQITSANVGLTLIEIGPFAILPTTEGAELKKTQFNFQVIGSYVSFKAFLNRLETSARIINVENISFSSPTEGESFTFNLTITVYSY